ncbi:MAG TPA: hypothetical protein EYP06_04690, partial [Desulfobacterales bacterium]|nr:hypothetical protein [Desulfobacterales bacterium]
ILKDREVKAWTIAYLIQYYNWTAQFREALKLCQKLRSLYDKIKSPNFNILLCFREGLIYGALGLLDKADQSLNNGLKQLETGDDKFWRPRFLNTLGWIKSEKGHIDEALVLNKEALEMALAIGDLESIYNSRINLGENYMALGQQAKAKEELQKTLQHVRRPGLYYTRWRYRTRLYIAMAELNRKRGDLDQALVFANRALKLSKETRAKKHQIRALMVKGLVQIQKGNRTGIKSLEEAHSLARSVGARILIGQTARLINEYETTT